MRITLRHFRGQADGTFVFDPGLTLLSGVSGAGKTTILEAAFWALYGGSHVTPFGSKHQTVVELEIPELNLHVSRRRLPEVVEVKHQGATYQRGEAEKYLEGLLGSRLLFGAGAYLPQGERSPLISGSGAEKWEILRALTFGSASELDDPETYLTRLEEVEGQAKETCSRLTTEFEVLCRGYASDLEAAMPMCTLWVEKSGTLPSLEDLRREQGQTLAAVFQAQALEKRLKVLPTGKWVPQALEAKLETKLQALKLRDLQRRLSELKSQMVPHLEEADVHRLEMQLEKTRLYERLRELEASIPQEVNLVSVTERLAQAEEAARLEKLRIFPDPRPTEGQATFGWGPESHARYLVLEKQVRGLTRENLVLTGAAETLEALRTAMASYGRLGLTYHPQARERALQELEAYETWLERQTENTRRQHILETNALVEASKARDLERSRLAKERAESEETLVRLKADLGTEPTSADLEVLVCPHCGEGLRFDGKELVGGQKPLDQRKVKAYLETKVRLQKIEAQEAAWRPIPCPPDLVWTPPEPLWVLGPKPSQPRYSRADLMSLPIFVVGSLRDLETKAAFEAKIPEWRQAFDELEKLKAAQGQIWDQLEALKIKGSELPRLQAEKQRLLEAQTRRRLGLEEKARLEVQLQGFKPEGSLSELEGRYRQTLETFGRQKRLEPEIAALEAEIRSIPALEISPNLEAEIADLRTQIEDEKQRQREAEERDHLEAELTALGQPAERLRAVEASIAEAEKVLAAGKVYANLAQRQAKLESLETKVTEATTHLSRLTSLSTLIRDLANQAIDETVASLNAMLRTFLRVMFEEEIEVSLQLYREVGKRTKAHLKPQVNLTVRLRGQDYDSPLRLSGGELDRLSLALTMSLNRLSATPCLFLDEAMASLDNHLREKVLETIREHLGGVTVVHICHEVVEGYHDRVINITN